MRLGRLLGRLRPHAAALGVAAGLLAVSGALPGLAVWVLRSGLAAVADGDAGAMLRIGAASVALAVAQALALLVRTAITRRVAARVASALRREVHAAWLARAGSDSVGDGVAALTDEVDAVQYGVSALVTALRNPVTLAVLFGSAFTLAPALAVPAVLALGGALGVGALAARRVRSATADARRARASLAALAAEQVAAIEVIRVHGAERAESDRFAVRDAADAAARSALEVARVLPSAAVEVAAAVGVAGVLGLGANAVARGTLDGPTLIAFVAAVVLASRPLAGLAEVGALLERSLAALDRVDSVVRAASPSTGGDDVPDGPLGVRGERLGVRRAGRWILEDVRFEAFPGELTAIIGPTGAGKTTLLGLVSRRLVPDVGGISVVGGAGAASDLARLDARAWGRALAVVPQDGALFARTVAENVALGEGEIDPARVRWALDEAGAAFAYAGPLGIDTAVPERAVGWSGGERQRVAIARALYRGARVLLLDEPTANLDGATADAILAALRRLRGVTVLVATHDPRLVAACDRVVALDAGRRVVPAEEPRWTARSPR